MSERVTRFFAIVAPGLYGWEVTCDCGYLVTGWPNQTLARADMDNHVSRAHPREDTTHDREKD